jgi:hypothetical protein
MAGYNSTAPAHAGRMPFIHIIPLLGGQRSMPGLVALQCPTCGARLQIAADQNRFTCGHCGNTYLLEHKLQEMAAAERERLLPLATYTPHLRQWLKVGPYEIFVHAIFEEPVDSRRVVYAEVEYRNSGLEQLSCRSSQWVLYDSEGYTYDTQSESALFAAQERPRLAGERFLTAGMKVRGWVAFVIRKPAVVERLQFLTGHLTTKTAEFLLKP